MDRLQEIEIELELLKPQVKELHRKIENLNLERWQIIRNNCEHDYQPTGYGVCLNGIFQEEMQCTKCGKSKIEIL